MSKIICSSEGPEITPGAFEPKVRIPGVKTIDTPVFVDSFEHLVYLEMLSGHPINIPVVREIPPPQVITHVINQRFKFLED